MSEPFLPPPSDINLPHAHTVLGRIVRAVLGQERAGYEESSLPELLDELDRILRPYPLDPPIQAALPVAERAAAVARRLVEELEGLGYRGDRLGQCVRNLFECLGRPWEGAELSLRCGERPDSPLRP